MGVSVNAGAEHILIQIILFSHYNLWELQDTPWLNLRGLFYILLKLLAGRAFLCQTYWAGWNDSYQVAPRVSVWAGPAKRFLLLFLFMFMTIIVGWLKMIAHVWLLQRLQFICNQMSLGVFFAPTV